MARKARIRNKSRFYQVSDGKGLHNGRLGPADTISIELTARDDSCTSEVDLMHKYPEFDGRRIKAEVAAKKREKL
ncbi:hypothetical protein HFO33_12665 [Rhizobium leguminosarum]|uniref:hypothetical protein n=1 Tax=Rhizobium leguminosarum TaxID=384 RepID=UPI001C94F785|nr:hypothetical protein [Rhizobium leguminosarum]MBY5717420.1 hypothetical protein [Rhizobium leguminosarum]